MRGQKYDKTTKERAFALFETTDNVTAIAKKIKVPVETVRGWKRKYNEICDKDPEFVKVRALKKEQMVKDAWRGIELSVKLILRRLERAIEEEQGIDELLDMVDELAREEKMPYLQREALLRRVSTLKCEDPAKLATVLGTLYDKQALASGDSTVNADVTVTPFEDL